MFDYKKIMSQELEEYHHVCCLLAIYKQRLLELEARMKELETILEIKK